MPQWVEGKIAENIHWTDNLFTLKIDADIDKFAAGQFTSLALDIDGERIARPYSFLNSPDQSPLEFFFYTAIDGKLSNALVKLKVGDSVWIKQQVNGFFVLSEIPPCKDIWMLGTGTGIAPYLSILNTPNVWERFDRVVLIQAVRTQADLLYQELISKLEDKYQDQFFFQAFVSREKLEGTFHGRITATLEDQSLEKYLGLDLNVKNSHIMLCGNPEMTKDSVEILKRRGFSKHRRRKPGQITVENYW